MAKLTDRISHRLMKDMWMNPDEILIPNYFVGRYEMDMFHLKKNGYIYEYEIKISRANFLDDFKKSHEELMNKEDYLRNNADAIRAMVTKHEHMVNSRRCNRFFFVMPEGTINIDECPKNCGLIFYDETHDRLYQVKSAPMLHKEPIHGDLLFKLTRSLAHREMRWRNKLNRFFPPMMEERRRHTWKPIEGKRQEFRCAACGCERQYHAMAYEYYYRKGVYTVSEHMPHCEEANGKINFRNFEAYEAMTECMRLLAEIDRYIKPSKENYIGFDSILHKKVQDMHDKVQKVYYKHRD